MASYAKDPRCIAMAEAVVPLLRHACPEGAGGYDGSYQVNLDDEEAVGLGGVELIRAAMRKAARQLGWKVTTIGLIGTRFGTMVAVQDTREVPEEYRPVVDAAMERRMSAAVARVSGEHSEAPPPSPTSSSGLRTPRRGPRADLPSPAPNSTSCTAPSCAASSPPTWARSRKALRADIPFVQQRLNDWMDAPSRAEATDEQLRDAIIQAAAWLADPETYYTYVTPQAIEPGGLPAPVHTKPAPADSSCSLCAAPVAAGELIGRMPRPRQPFVAMAWLCAHCLFDRRAKPRLADVVLRVFHHAFSGSSTVPLNTAEVQVLSEALARVPAETANVQEACDALDQGIDGNAPVMLLSERLALAAVAALQAAEAATDAHGVTILTAVAEHLSQWGHDPQGLDKKDFADVVLWRQAVLANTEIPTVLSERGGPFWV
ncbi:hypothetical protein ACIQ8G_26670 [Streptomyces sp. NPDC094154]|uniref:hypothetical protein n=1 Tax=Streptomyces sp. NPDC094154 TaxID=3366059 RepID=UPI00383069F8